MSMAETPILGIMSTVGPLALPSFEAMILPSSAFSSRVVRIRVTSGLWGVELTLGIFRRNRFPRAEIDHVQRAEGDDLRHAHLACRFNPIGSCAQHPAR